MDVRKIQTWTLHTCLSPTETKITNTAMATAPQSSSEKKQKLASSTLNKTQLLLQDYTTVRQTVRDILALVQQFGPLTSSQIEYNLPRVPSAIWGIPDVLNILSSLEILGVTESHTYTWNGGVPRADTVLPTDVMNKIVTAMQEAEVSWKRSEILKQAVLKKSDPKEVLNQLLTEFPDIVEDPVYLEALKASNIDLRGKIKRESKPTAVSPRAMPGPAASPRQLATASPRVVPGSAVAAPKPVAAPTAAVTAAAAVPQGATTIPSTTVKSQTTSRPKPLSS